MKNTIYVIVIAVCLVLAVVIFLVTRGGGSAGLDTMQRGELTWVMCNNPACKATYEIDLKDYYTELQEKARINPVMAGTPALVCKECNEESIFRAVKCEKCGHMFFHGNPADFDDRCPECKFSKIEDERRKRREARGG
jgi:predicted Zn-ribbon and HTH transcriptional regulator